MLPTMIVAARAVCRGALCSVVPHPSNAYRPYALRHPVLAFLNALFIMATVGSSLALSLTPEIARLSTIAAPTIVRLTNAERAKAGLQALKENASLRRSAQLKAEHMLRHDYFEHTSPDGLSPWVWFGRASYDYAYAGENLAIDFSEAEDAVAAWMRSTSHRRNLLSDRYEETGIATATGEFQGRTATIIVHHFGARRLAPPTARKKPQTPNVAQATTPFRLGAAVSLGEAEPRREPRRTPSPLPLAAPVLFEPLPGITIGSGATAVRGTAPADSIVEVTLDDDLVGTYTTTGGIFQGTFTPPANEERDAKLAAIATRGTGKSPISSPVTIRLDTKAPVIAAERALILPDPLGIPGMALLAVSIPEETQNVVLEGTGTTPQPLTRLGTMASARLAFIAGASLSLRVNDAQGNTRTVTLQPFLPYVTAAEDTETPRARVAAAASRLRPTLVVLLAVLASLLGLNILAHLRIHRLLHGDLLAHAAFVLMLGTTLVLLA